jgi:hypothetical protein
LTSGATKPVDLAIVGAGAENAAPAESQISLLHYFDWFMGSQGDADMVTASSQTRPTCEGAKQVSAIRHTWHGTSNQLRDRISGLRSHVCAT